MAVELRMEHYLLVGAEAESVFCFRRSSVRSPVASHDLAKSRAYPASASSVGRTVRVITRSEALLTGSPYRSLIGVQKYTQNPTNEVFA